LKEVILSLQIFQSLICYSLLLFIREISIICCSRKTSFNYLLVFLGAKKIFHQHTPMIVVPYKSRNCWLNGTALTCHL
jgi:hypothetical protein